RRARARQQIAIGIGRVAQAHMPESVEHALVGKHAARKRKLIAEVVQGLRHGSHLGWEARYRKYAWPCAHWQAPAALTSSPLASFCQNAVDTRLNNLILM